MTTAGFSELLTANRFYLELKLGGNEMTDAVFLECKGFRRSQEVAEIWEVAPEKWGQAKVGRSLCTKIPGNAKAENIILRRGMTQSTTLWKWFAEVESGHWADQLKEGSLVIYDQDKNECARFNFQGAFPIRYSAADLNAQSSDMEIEELEMAVESCVRVC